MNFRPPKNFKSILACFLRLQAALCAAKVYDWAKVSVLFVESILVLTAPNLDFGVWGAASPLALLGVPTVGPFTRAW